MKTLYVTVILLLGIILESAGAGLQSGVDSNALCPGERVTFNCTVSSLSHEWRLQNGSTLQRIDTITNGNLNDVLGSLGFELTVVEVAGTAITSAATVTTTTDLNGTVIVCRDSLVTPPALPQQQNATLNIIGAPTAPSITGLSVDSRTNDIMTIKADLSRPVSGFECIQNYTVIVQADGEEIAEGISTSPDDLFVLVPGLSVCPPPEYTFTAFACSPFLPCSGESAPVPRDGLLAVTNITSDGVSLRWNEPRNAPAGCITNYTIMWDDRMFTTPDSTTSIPIDDIEELEFCRNYTSITVTPIVPSFGPVQNSSGELLSVTFIPSDFPSPSSLRVENFTYSGLGIAVQLRWNVTSQNMDTTVNVSVGYSRSMATCLGSDGVAQDVSGPDLPTAAEVRLDHNFIGEDAFFCVIFTLNDCEERSDTTSSTSFPRFITDVDTVSTNTSADVAITYNESITIGPVSDFNVTVSVNPGGITRFRTLSFPNQSILLSGLQPSTNYDGTVKVVNNTGVTVDELGLNFDTMSVLGGGPSVGAIAGGTIGGAVVALIIISVIGLVVSGVWWLVLIKKGKKASKCHKITFMVFLILTLVGILFAIAIWCWFKKNEKGQRDEDVELKEPSPVSSPAVDSGQPTAVYADPNTIQREEYPGTQDFYTVPDKKKKKHKPEDHLPTYQDPSTISHEVAPTGDMYAQPDKPKKPRGSKKNQQEAPQPTQEQLAEMYSQPDKSKKQQSQGLTYTHIDFHGSGKVPDTQPGVVYSDVKPQQ